MLSLHYVAEDQVLTASRNSALNIWNVTIFDAPTCEQLHVIWTDKELAASMALAISGGFGGDIYKTGDPIDDYLYDIAEPVTSNENNLRIIP